jgi:hypothetical protein
VLEREKMRVKVEYDNGDQEWAATDYISPDNLPVDFGKEKSALQVGLAEAGVARERGTS